MSFNSRPARVAIVGGGWAGLACAEHLARLTQDQQSIAVSLFEAAPQFGGRARGLVWTPTAHEPRFIDNGQHLTVGAYEQTFALLNRCGAPPWHITQLNWTGVARNATAHRSWTLSATPLAIRAALALVGPFAPTGWPLRWKYSLVKALLAMARANWRDSHGMSVSEWLTQQRVPSDLTAHFWQPLTEGALNTEIHRASTAVLMRVIKDTLAGPAQASQVLTPPVNLSVDGVDWITRRLTALGVQLTTGQRVNAISATGSVKFAQSNQQGSHAFDAIVIALPAPASLQLWRSSGLAVDSPTPARWAALQTRAITTIWIACTPEQMAALDHLPNWFVLDPQPGIAHLAQVAVKRPGVLAFVVSAQQGTASPTPAERASMEIALHQQIAAQLGLDLSGQPHKWITEKTATFACTTEAPAPSPNEVLGLTDLPLIFRAADDLEPSYPATIESAVRSGQRTAQTVMRYLSKPAA